MTWKTTVVMSGAGLVATWLAAAPPTEPAAPLASASVPTATVVSPIEREAARLARGLAYQARLGVSARNPFRFDSVDGPVGDGDVVVAPLEAPLAVVEPSAAPATTRLSLVGIATNLVDGATERTAIVTGPTGVVLAGVGDSVGDGYRVMSIEADAVDLVRDDNAQLTIRLRP
jgi:hypothetical protein